MWRSLMKFLSARQGPAWLLAADGAVIGYVQPSRTRRGRWYVKMYNDGDAESFYVGPITARLLAATRS